MGFTRSQMEERLLPLITKPSRYIAPFALPVSFEGAGARVLIARPESYETALSGSRCRALFHALAGACATVEPAGFADLVFAPPIEMGDSLRARGQALFGLASHRAVSEYDVVVLHVDRVLDWPVALRMLHLGGVSLRSIGRDAGPIVVLAGDLAWAPGSSLPFVDGVLVGDPEAFAADLVHLAARARGGEPGTRVEALRFLGGRDGVLDPAGEAVVEARWLAEPPAPAAQPLAPLPEVDRDGLPLELARAAGPDDPAAPPPRLRALPLEFTLLDVERALAASGYADVLLDGASARHPDLVPFLERLHQRLLPMGVAARLLEADLSAFGSSLARELLKGGRGRLSFAPVLASERLRAAAGRPLARPTLVGAVEIALRAEWSQIALAFVVGAPGETDEDRAECLAMLGALNGIPARGNAPRIPVEIVSYVPHPVARHDASPPPPGSADPRKLVDAWRQTLSRGGRVRLLARTGRLAALESLMLRGPDAAARLVEAGAVAGLVHPGAGEGAVDPWLDLLREQGAALDDAGSGSATAIARIRPGTIPAGVAPPVVPAPPVAGDADGGFGVPGWGQGRRVKRGARPREARRADRYRIRFAKGEPLRLTSHLDVARGLERAFRRAQLPLAYSQGKDRRPRLSFGPPLPLGMTSGTEYLDVSFSREVPESFTSVMNAMLPEGLSIVAAAPIRNEAPSLSSAVEIADYEVWFPESVARGVFGDLAADELKERLERRVAEALASTTLLVTKVRKDRTETLNVRPSLIRAEVVRDDGGRPVLSYRLTLNRSDSVRPESLTAALCNWAEFDERLPRVHRSALYVPARREMLDPLDVVRADFAWWRQPVKGGTVA